MLKVGSWYYYYSRSKKIEYYEVLKINNRLNWITIKYLCNDKITINCNGVIANSSKEVKDSELLRLLYG